MKPNYSLVSAERLDATLGLGLTFSPGNVFADTTASLTLIISVAQGDPAVTFATTDSITVTFPVASDSNPSGLVTTLTGITTTPPSAVWNATGPRLGSFKIYPSQTVTIQPGDTVQIQFNGLPIVKQPVNVSVPLTVSIGGSTQKTSAGVVVQANTPGIIAWADPPVIGINALSTLRWTTICGTQVRVYGYNTVSVPSGYKDFPVGGANNTTVNPSADAPNATQQTYSLQLLSEPGDQQVGSTQNVVVNVHVPFVAQYGLLSAQQSVAASSVTINYGDTVTARWNCKFVDPNQGVTLSYNSSNLVQPPIGSVTFDPSNGLPTDANSVSVLLNAPGFRTPARQTAVVNYHPIVILYLKYTTWTQTNGVDTLSGITYAMSPNKWQSATLNPVPGSFNVQCLTVHGPGGKQVRFLGQGNDSNLEVRYFSTDGPSSTNQPVTAGTPFTLYWFTNAATSLTLTTPSGDQQIPAAQIAKGSSGPFTITAATTFRLTAQSGQQSVTSYLTVVPS